MTNPDAETLACLQTLAAIATLKGDPTPLEFEAFLRAITIFQPLPAGVTPEALLARANPAALGELVPHITSPELQQKCYRSAYAILRSQGLDPPEVSALTQIRQQFQLSEELAASLARQPLGAMLPGEGLNSTLVGMAALIHREGEMRRLIFDYCLGAAMVGLIPLRGGGTLEMKLLVVSGLILKMIWDIRQGWGKPRGQDVLAVMGNLFGFMAAVMAGFLAWIMMVGLGVVVPYAGAFAQAAGFATATWVAGQSTNQFYTSAKRPDLTALRRAFPRLLGSD
jgi:hypothetical protein